MSLSPTEFRRGHRRWIKWQKPNLTQPNRKRVPYDPGSRTTLPSGNDDNLRLRPAPELEGNPEWTYHVTGDHCFYHPSTLKDLTGVGYLHNTPVYDPQRRQGPVAPNLPLRTGGVPTCAGQSFTNRKSRKAAPTPLHLQKSEPAAINPENSWLMSATPPRTPVPSITIASPGHQPVSAFSPASSSGGNSPTTGRQSGHFPISRFSDFSSVAGSPQDLGYLGPVPPFSPLDATFLCESPSTSPSSRRSQRS